MSDQKAVDLVMLLVDVVTACSVAHLIDPTKNPVKLLQIGARVGLGAREAIEFAIVSASHDAELQQCRKATIQLAIKQAATWFATNMEGQATVDEYADDDGDGDADDDDDDDGDDYNDGVDVANDVADDLADHMDASSVAVMAWISVLMRPRSLSLQPQFPPDFNWDKARRHLLEVNLESALFAVQAYYALRVQLAFQLRVDIPDEARAILCEAQALVDDKADLMIHEAEKHVAAVQEAVSKVKMIGAKATLVARFTIPTSIHEFFIKQLTACGPKFKPSAMELEAQRLMERG